MLSPDLPDNIESGTGKNALTHLSSNDIRVYTGKRISVSIEQWQDERNRIHRHETVLFGEGVAIVPVIEGKILLIRQFRPSIAGSILEIPAGKVDPEENIREAALRELAEETGVVGGKLTLLASIRTTPGFCDERIHLFLSTDGRLEESHPEDGETIEDILLFPFMDIQRMILSGEITDAKSIVGLLLVLNMLGVPGNSEGRTGQV